MANIVKKKINFLTKAQVKYPLIDYSLIKFIDSYSKVEFICSKHGIFSKEPKLFLRSGCSKCLAEVNNIKRIAKYALNFITKAKIKYPMMNYSEVNYIAQDIPIIIIHPVHGKFEITPKLFLRHGYIHNTNIDTTYKFITLSNNVHNNIYDYTNSVYIDCKTNIEINCSIHGPFLKTSYNHIMGQGCPSCKNLIHKNLSTSKSFITKAKKVHSDKAYDYSLVLYKHSRKKVKILCPLHGVFEQTPNNHLGGQGCSKCGQKYGKIEKEIAELIPNSILNNRTIIKPLELDIYSKEHNFAIEYNGLMWHSFGKSKSSTFNNYMNETRDKNKHLIKTELCEEQNIQLFHIFENEWLNPIKQNIWKSIINSKLGKNHIINQYTINKITKKDAVDFLELNHLQGYLDSDYHIGCFNKENLIGVVVRNTLTTEVRLCSLNSIDIIFDRVLLNLDSSIIRLNRRWNIVNMKLDNIKFEEPEALRFNRYTFTDIVPENEEDKYRTIYDCGYININNINNIKIGDKLYG